MCTISWRISQRVEKEAISRQAKDTPETPRPAPGGKDRVAPRGALGETAARPDPCRLGRAGAGVNWPLLLGWRTHTTTRSVCGGTISWWTGSAQMDSEQLLAALRDDIEWPAATKAETLHLTRSRTAQGWFSFQCRKWLSFRCRLTCSTTTGIRWRRLVPRIYLLTAVWPRIRCCLFYVAGSPRRVLPAAAAPLPAAGSCSTLLSKPPCSCCPAATR